MQRHHTVSLTGLLTLALLSAPASAQRAGAGGTPDIQQLVEELRALTERAERRGRNDPAFIATLQEFIDTYEQPWTRTVLSDDFSDGDHSRAPAWSVIEGDFAVDGRYGLVARPQTRSSGQGDSRRELAAAIIGGLLGGQGGGAAATSNARARIETPVALANAFAVEADLSAIGRGAVLQLGVAQGAGDGGYRLVVQDSANPTLRLERAGSRGGAVIASHDGRLQADTRGLRRLRWTRGRNGLMRVLLNGEALLEATDRGLRDGFTRVVVESIGGEVGLRRISAATLP